MRRVEALPPLPFGGRGAIVDQGPSQIRRASSHRRTVAGADRNRVNRAVVIRSDFVKESGVAHIAGVERWLIKGSTADEIVQGEPAGTDG
jgi:hypothetical protein